MRKPFSLLLSAAMLLSAGALAGTQAPAGAGAKVTKTKKCLFPKSRKRAPNWVCNARADGFALAAVGSAAKSRAGTSFMEQMAAADARAHLAWQVRRSVQNEIRGGEDTAIKHEAERDSASITEIANDTLQGAQTVKSAYAPDGTLYVLVGLDEANARKLVESVTADYLEQKRK